MFSKASTIYPEHLKLNTKMVSAETCGCDTGDARKKRSCIIP